MKLFAALLLSFWLIGAHAAEDLWNNLRGGFSLPAPEDSSGVEKQEAWYADHPQNIENIADNAKRYLYYIVSEVQKRGMPSEIALVPMIESGFNPLVYSRYHAAGIWQILPGTGKHFGLHSNEKYDGRRDIVAATRAALDYLSHLHDLFGDWPLALAAYNAGEGTLLRALNNNRQKGLETNISMLTLPRETRLFYDKLFALRNVLNEPEKFGVDLSPIPDEPYFASVKAGKDFDLRSASRITGISESEFSLLNPGIKGTTWTARNAKSILVPADKADEFESSLASLPPPSEKAHARQVVYAVRKGDTLNGIAHRFGMKPSEIMMKNRIKSAKALRIGSKLVLVQRPTP
jgi:membrane-bound lytic murein transglycosylase D